jgi:hypothetical protein
MVRKHPDSVIITEEEDPKSYKAIDLSCTERTQRNATLAPSRHVVTMRASQGLSKLKTTTVVSDSASNCLQFLREHGPSDLKTLCGPFKFGTLRSLHRRGLIKWEQGPNKEFLWSLP